MNMKRDWLVTVMHDTSLPPGARLLAFGIWNEIAGKKSVVLANSTIGPALGLCNRSVTRYTGVLKKAGYIEAKRNGPHPQIFSLGIGKGLKPPKPNRRESALDQRATVIALRELNLI